jgi:hypothetical protein
MAGTSRVATGFKMRLPIAIFLALMATSASAADFCATTSAQLQAHLNTAASNFEADVIRVERGIYLPANDAGFSANIIDGKYLSVLGGFDRGPGNAFCGIQTHGAGGTILDGVTGTGANNRRLLKIHSQGVSAAGILLYNLTFMHGKGTDTEPVIQIDGDSAWGGDIDLRNISMRENEMDKSLARFAGAGRIFLVGSEFVNNSGVTPSAYVLDIATNGAPVASAAIYFNNNTIAENDVPDSNAAMLVGITSTRDVRVANSIVVGNNGKDLFFNGPHLYMSNSVARSHFIATGSLLTETNPYFILPTFVSATDFHLLAPSAFIDGGIDGALGGVGDVDVAGDPRIVGIVDVGAYESQDQSTDVIFRDDFEIHPSNPLRN